MRLFNVFTSFSKASIEQKVSKVNLNLQNSVDKVSIRCYYGGVRCRTDTKKDNENTPTTHAGKQVSKAKHILSSAIARCIVADAKRKGKRPPPFEGTRALVERQGWRKIIRLTAKCFLLLPLQQLLRLQ